MPLENDFELESIFQDHPIEVENWRGLSLPGRKALTVGVKPIYIYILQNGNVAISKNSNIILTNTCAFDATAQAFAVAYKDRLAFKQYVDSTKAMDNDIFTLLIIELSTAQKHKQRMYNLREKLLTKVFHPCNINYSKTTIINCVCNVTKIFDYICTTYFSAIRTRNCTNMICTSPENNKIYNCKYIPLQWEIITRKGIENLQESIESCLNTDPLDTNLPICICCGIGRVKFYYELKYLIIIELHDIYINIENVPHNIEINKKIYLILAIIEFEPPAHPAGIGHYRAHCFRSMNKSYECYDDLYTKIQNGLKNIMPHAIIYTCQ